MHAAVVELDPLTDPVRAAAQDHDPRPVGWAHLVLVLVRRVVVRRLGGELGGACVDGLVGRDDTGGFTYRPNAQLVTPPEVGKLTVAEPHLLGATPLARRQIGVVHVGERGTLLDDLLHLIEKPRIDAARLVDRFDRLAASKQFADLKDSIRGRCGDHLQECGHIDLGELRLGRIATEAQPPLFERAKALLKAFRKGSPDRHDLTDRLHLRAEDPG